MHSPTVTSYAVLSVNYDQHRRDFLETFVPFVAHVIQDRHPVVISLPEVQIYVREDFGLDMPQGVLKKIAKRLCRQGMLTSKHDTYYPDFSKLLASQFDDRRRQVIQDHERLVSDLSLYVSDKFRRSWTLEHAETALITYLNTELLPLRHAAQPPQHSAELPAVASERFMVAAYIYSLYESHSSLLEYLARIFTGNMVANALFLPLEPSVLSNLRRTEVYFDTRFLIWALGYADLIRQAPCMELIGMLTKAGAHLKCFDHTANEIRGILRRCADRASIKRSSTDPVHWYETDDYFVRMNYGLSDILMLSEQLESNLENLGIEVIPAPPYAGYEQFVPAERQLEELLLNHMGYSSAEACQADVNSYSAVLRLRRGQREHRLERCTAIFVTDNDNLVRETSSFYRSADPRDNSIPPMLSDSELSTLLWLRSPVKAPDLPRKRIIADCYAALQPGEHLFESYVRRIELLEQEGAIDADQYVTLRYSQVAREELMTLTLGDINAFSQGTVHELLERLKRKHQAEVAAALDEERRHRQMTEAELRSTQLALASQTREVSQLEQHVESLQQAHERRERESTLRYHKLRERAHAMGMMVGTWSYRGLFVGFAALVVLGVFYFAFGPASLAAKIGSGIGTMVSLVGLLALFGFVPRLPKVDIRDKVARRVELFLLDWFGLDFHSPSEQ